MSSQAIKNALRCRRACLHWIASGRRAHQQSSLHTTTPSDAHPQPTPTPSSLLSHPANPLQPPQSLSDIQISSFYNALMSQPPPIPALPQLTPSDLAPLLNLKPSDQLPALTRSQIIHKLSPQSPLVHRFLPLELSILSKTQPWFALLQSAAFDENVDDLVKVFTLAQDFRHDPSLLFGQVLSIFKTGQDPEVAKRMENALHDAAEKIGLSSSSAAHQIEVYRLLHSSLLTPTAAFQAADKYVRKLEQAGKPPPPEVYLQLFDFLNYVSMKRVNSIDLFNRLRLVAHPNPPISIWNALLRALGSGASPSPERAMDAFLDLKANGLTPTVETYNHLIRSMIRARRSAIGSSDRKRGYEKWYYSALRLLKQMIDDDGLRPNLATFVVLLEGAKRVGDLARAKWTYGLFLQQLESERSNGLVDDQKLDWIHVSAGSCLLQTYASFKPANKYLQVRKKTSGHALALTSFKDPEFFKTLPRTTHEILAEAELVLSQFIDLQPPHHTYIHARNHSEQRQRSMLLSSYLSVYSSHSTIDELYSKFNTYTHPIEEAQVAHQSGSIRTSWTYLILLERCEFLRSAEKAGEIGRRVFHEWLAHSPILKKFELVQSVESRLISQIWAAWIRLQAKYGNPDEAMEELEKFHEMYPPPQPIRMDQIGRPADAATDAPVGAGRPPTSEPCLGSQPEIDQPDIEGQSSWDAELCPGSGPEIEGQSSLDAEPSPSSRPENEGQCSLNAEPSLSSQPENDQPENDQPENDQPEIEGQSSQPENEGQSSLDAESSPSSQPENEGQSSLDAPYLSFQHLEILHVRLKAIADYRAIRRLTHIVKMYEVGRRTHHEFARFNRSNRIQKGYLP